MKTLFSASLTKIGRLAITAWMFTHIPATAAPSDDFEIMTRGPIHEAFAGTVAYDPEPGMLVKIAPPAAIEELPPEQQLEGENVVWIPGYWAWDDEINNFLWISGVWRNLPPGREWVPGYWNPVDGQYQWISGYWAEIATAEAQETMEVSYLPAPPRSLEVGPSVAAVSTSHIWLPGSWVYRQNRYAWRSGYWVEPRPNWVYIPSHYIWTPRGYIYVDGYWDYAIPRRGVVFAPIHFHRPIYSRHGYRYSPSLVISLSVFSNHLFLRPRYRHYYFGDYYAPSYMRRGYYASYDYHRNRRGYDPIYAYDRWRHRNDDRWDRNHRNQYELRRDRESERPPRTWASLQTRQEYREGDRAFASTLDRYVDNRKKDGMRFRSVDKPSRERMIEQNRRVRDFGVERQRAEGRVDRSSRKVDQVTRAKRSSSPIFSRAKADRSPERMQQTRDNREVRRDDSIPRERTENQDRTRRSDARIPEAEETPRNRRNTPRAESPERVNPEVTPPMPNRNRERNPRVEPPDRTEADSPRRTRENIPRVERPERVQPPATPQRTREEVPRVERKERVQPPVVPQRTRESNPRVEPPKRVQPPVVPQRTREDIPRVERRERVQPPVTPQRTRQDIPRVERRERVQPPVAPQRTRENIPRVERTERVQRPVVPQRTRENIPRVERRERVQPPVAPQRSRETPRVERTERGENERGERDRDRRRDR